MNKHIRKNSDMDPNMLLILLLILSAYSRKPIYFCDKELLTKRHNNVSEDYTSKSKVNDNTSKSMVNDELNVLNENKDLQKTADSNLNQDSHFDANYDSNTDTDINFNYIKDVDSYAIISASKNDKDCGEVINTEIVPEYPNKLIKPNVDNNQLVVTVPVLLSQFEIEFACESIVELEYPAEDIKSIKKNVFLNECKLMPRVNKLFLSGIVRKDIEYSAIREEKNIVKNNIRHMTIEVPFKCTTKVEYIAQPIINYNIEQIEIEMLSTDGKSNELLDKSYISSECFNEKIYCKLISDEIKELNITENADIIDSNDEKGFRTLNEKMIIKLTLKLIQDQQINVNQ